jgi:hypothetical protein
VPRDAPRFAAPVMPLVPEADDATFRLWRSGTTAQLTPFGSGARVIAVAADGQIAYVDRVGRLWLTDSASRRGNAATSVDQPVTAGSYAPGEPALALVVGSGARAGIERYDPSSGQRDELSSDGLAPRWLP